MGLWASFYLGVTLIAMVLTYFSGSIAYQKTGLMLFVTWALSNFAHNFIEQIQLEVVFYSIIDLLAALYVLRLWSEQRSKLILGVAIIFIVMVCNHVSFLAAGVLSHTTLNLILNILYFIQCSLLEVGSIILLVGKYLDNNRNSFKYFHGYPSLVDSSHDKEI